MTKTNNGSNIKLQRIDCQPVGGVAGDMFAAALFDAFPALYQRFVNDLALIGVDGLTASLAPTTSHSLYAQYFSVQQNTSVKPPRTLPAVSEFLNCKTLDPDIVTTAVGIYRLLAEAEAAVHGKTVDTVHFHEVSDWDSMVDILAAAGIISRLQCPHWRIGPLPLGGGTTKTAHGDIPLPAPATVHLLTGADWIDDGQPGERVTPTGAAIVAYLSPSRLLASEAPATLSAVGAGCGTRKLSDRANIFRVCVFAAGENNTCTTDLVTQLAFEVDDMTGEEIALSLDVLREQPHVLDASTVAIHGKKGRPATGVRLLVEPHAAETVINDCFNQTTTLGVRYSDVQRKVLQRSHKMVDGKAVKIATRPDSAHTVKIESGELVTVETLYARRTLAQKIERSATDD